MPVKPAEVREMSAERQIDLPEKPKPFETGDEHLISLVAGLHGDLHALSSHGRIFKYGRDPDRQFEPGVHMAWIEVRGPKF